MVGTNRKGAACIGVMGTIKEGAALPDDMSRAGIPVLSVLSSH